MIQKNYIKNSKICRVTFKLPAIPEATTVKLCGDFTEWQQSALLMNSLKDGSFSTTVSLPIGYSYRFRYLLNDTQWLDDSEADSYVENPFGSRDSVIIV